METKKRAIVCGIGCAIGTIVALICAPMFWWLGMLAGFVSGYLCYDLREVRVKIPSAWEHTKNNIIPPAKEALLDFFFWVKEPHPFGAAGMAVFLSMLVPLVYFLYLEMNRELAEEEFLFNEIFICGLYGIIFIAVAVTFIGISLVVRMGLFSLAEKGSADCKYGKNCYWKVYDSWFALKNRARKGKNEIEPTYANIYGLILRGIAIIVYNGVKAGWKFAKKLGIETIICIRIIVFSVIKLPFVFFWILFKLIHSRKRVLCGFDSAIGVAITYILIGTNSVTFPEKAFAVICGGIIGAAIGAVNYEIVSRRILRLSPT